ncbi:MAG: methyltransferase domain-containing protein [Candidatus Margulisbacteria bacterium]|nr:methyltransferase domain-containing protein [Candidatus Margulisiibacteriota bacterium]
MEKLQIGCGHVIKKGWVNHDLVSLPGVDVTHDLDQFPWPWEDQVFEEVYMKDVLEHVSDVIKTLEELHRIMKPGGKIFVAVPYWNSFEAITDPTHKNQFNEFTFQFFDPTHRRCKNRPYYSKARFKIAKQGFVVGFLRPYVNLPIISRSFVVYNPVLKWCLGFLASHFSNIIIGIDIHFERV